MALPTVPARKGWSFFAHRLNGDGSETPLAVDIPFSSPTFTDELSGPDSFTASLAPEIQALKNPSGGPLFVPWSTAIYVEKDDVIRYGFLVTAVRPNGPALEVEGRGFVNYIDGMPWTNSTKKLYQADPADIVRMIWTYVQMHPRGNIGVQLTPPNLTTPVKLGVKSAASKSAGEVQDEPVLLAAYATHDLGQLMDEVTEAGSIDYTERHTRQADGTITHELVLAHPRLGARRSDIRFTIGENVIPVPPGDMDYTDYASEVVVLGAGEGDKMIRGHAYNPGADRLRRVAVQVAKHIGRTETAIRSAAVRAKAMSSDGFSVSEITVHDHPNAPLFSWNIGDEVRLTGDGMWAGQVDLWVRILSASYAPATHSESATLRVARAERT